MYLLKQTSTVDPLLLCLFSTTNNIYTWANIYSQIHSFPYLLASHTCKPRVAIYFNNKLSKGLIFYHRKFNLQFS